MARQEKFLIISPAQCRAARAHIGMSQTELAEAAQLGLSTVYDFEKERRAVADVSIEALRKALEKAGLEFIDGNGIRPKAKRRRL